MELAYRGPFPGAHDECFGLISTMRVRVRPTEDCPKGDGLGFRNLGMRMLTTTVGGSTYLPNALLGSSVWSWFCVRMHQSIARRKRSAFPMTETELKLIAAAAIIGLKSNPKAG